MLLNLSSLSRRQVGERCLAEAIGTFAIVFAGCGAISSAKHFGLSPALIPIVFGLVVATMIYALGHISGAHFNPAVTTAFWVVKKFPRSDVLPYIASQTVGALLGMLLLYFVVGDRTAGATVPAVAPIGALIMEIVMTVFLMLVIMGSATDERASRGMAGLAIGGVVAMDAAFGGPLTGASMNPARTLAPAMVLGQYQGLWIYVVGPFVGATLGAVLYKAIHLGDAESISSSKAVAETAAAPGE